MGQRQGEDQGSLLFECRRQYDHQRWYDDTHQHWSRWQGHQRRWQLHGNRRHHHHQHLRQCRCGIVIRCSLCCHQFTAARPLRQRLQVVTQGHQGRWSHHHQRQCCHQRHYHRSRRRGHRVEDLHQHHRRTDHHRGC